MTRTKQMMVELWENSVAPEGTGTPLLTAPRPLMAPYQSMWMRVAYMKFARDCVAETFHGKRDEMCRHTPYFRERMLGYRMRGLVYKAVANHVSTDGQSDISRICLAMPQVYDKDDRKWHVIDSHIWLRMNAIRMPEGKGDRLALRLGDTLNFWGAYQGYRDKTGHSRNGVSWWAPTSSELTYLLRRNGRVAETYAKAPDGYCHDLVWTDPEAEYGWSVATSDIYEKDKAVLWGMADTMHVFINVAKDSGRDETKGIPHFRSEDLLPWVKTPPAPSAAASELLKDASTTPAPGTLRESTDAATSDEKDAND